jgi:lysophospholipid acyltransferase (LPLAT)-like uncharacterized protein
MALLKRITASNAFQEAIGALGAGYLKLAWYTSRRVFDPPNINDTIPTPAIFTMWHGQHFLTPFVGRNEPRFRAKALISRHRDGEINARAAARLGIEAIRGSGAHNGEFRRKGGATAFNEMVQALKDGYNVALTADVPKVARVCGMGVVKLAQYSGRPINTTAIASSRRIELDNWDRSAVNLPFSRIALVAGKPITVARDADDAELEKARQMVEDELNRITARAYAIVDGKDGATA